MAELQVSCPHCVVELSIDEGYGGQMVGCPSCSGEFEMPVVQAPPAIPTPQPLSQAGQQEEIPKWGYYLGAGVFVGLAWLVLVAERIFGVSLSGMKFRKIEAGSEIPFWAILAVTVIAPIVAYLLYRRAVGVAKHGVDVVGQIVKVGGEVSGMQNITFSYSVGGKVFKKRKSLMPDPSFVRGGPITLMVDSRKPSRCYVKKELFAQPGQG